MSELLYAFQRKHLEKLDQLKRGETDETFLDGVHLLISDLREAGAIIADPAERGQLRALMRFWGGIAYDRAGVYPDTTLLPLDPEHARPPKEPTRQPLPPLAWVLVGGAAVIVIVVGLLAIGWLPQLLKTPEPEVVATPTPSVSYAAVEVLAGDTFCQGVSEVVAEFAFEGIRPETVWRWEVQREGDIVASQPAAPWGQAAQRATARVLTGGPEGVEPGQYDLLVYADERVVGVRSFRVLDAAPRVFNLQVADVPELAEEPSDKFEADVRVLYLSYEYEGLCPGMEVSHALYHDGGFLRERAEVWSSAAQGQAQIAFQAPNGQPFSAGSYEATVTIAGGEPEHARFTIGEIVEEMEESPAFGDIILALGMQPDGTPILTTEDNHFDWNTKVVYAIFDYAGMSDGVRWTVVWTRNEQEVARQEKVWDVASTGMEGTLWVAYYDEGGRTLPGGDYKVALYINSVIQSAVDFNILYYVPPEEESGQEASAGVSATP
jgi:hypothetical protein